jgi:hypothetical protein
MPSMMALPAAAWIPACVWLLHPHVFERAARPMAAPLEVRDERGANQTMRTAN